MPTPAAIVTILTAVLFLAAATMKLTGQELSLATRDRLGRILARHVAVPASA